jgi:NADH-quinone oxidoreductase subunit L
MVTAGVFMVARCAPLFVLSHTAMNVVAVVGGVTAIFAATIGLVQNDIKRVIAYSTISQLGYMFLGLGVGAFAAGIFHLTTHAFFKGLLFLASGSVIHALSGEQDMRKMGSLKSKIKVTYWVFIFGTLALTGIFPFAGFFSKDEILTAAFHHNKLLFAVEYAVAGLTAFYMFRLYFSVFWGKETHYHHTPHEAPATMTIPLIILAAGSIFAGFIPFDQLVTSDSKSFESHIEMAIAIPSVLIGLIGIGIAFIMYRKESALPDIHHMRVDRGGNGSVWRDTDILQRRGANSLQELCQLSPAGRDGSHVFAYLCSGAALCPIHS